MTIGRDEFANLPRIVLARHGFTPGNENREVYTDIPNKSMELLPEGIQQARLLGVALGSWFGANGVRSADVWTSDYRRAIQTEAEAAPFFGVPVNLRHSHELREADFGHCDGWPVPRMWALHRAEMEAFQRDKFNNARPGGESERAVADRAGGFLAGTALPEHAASSADVLVLLSHSKTQRALAMLLTGSGPEFFREHSPNNCEAWLIENGRLSVLFGGFPERVGPGVGQPALATLRETLGGGAGTNPAPACEPA